MKQRRENKRTGEPESREISEISEELREQENWRMRGQENMEQRRENKRTGEPEERI